MIAPASKAPRVDPKINGVAVGSTMLLNFEA